LTFLLDNDVPDDVAYPIIGLGHEVIHLRDILPGSAPDAQVLAYAHQKSLILISCNRDDFLSLAGMQPHSGIIFLIRRRSRAAERVALVRLLDQAGEAGILNNINFA
jgi:predicted nuclease of predicted toxin-antitoxin system